MIDLEAEQERKGDAIDKTLTEFLYLGLISVLGWSVFYVSIALLLNKPIAFFAIYSIVALMFFRYKYHLSGTSA